jgi:hypothetical protein
MRKLLARLGRRIEHDRRSAPRDHGFAEAATQLREGGQRPCVVSARAGQASHLDDHRRPANPRPLFVPQESNDGSAFMHHVVLIWTVGDHTYGIGFHDVRGIRQTLALDRELAQGLELVGP